MSSKFTSQLAALVLAIFVTAGEAVAQCSGETNGALNVAPKLYTSTGSSKVDELLNKALRRMWSVSGQHPKFYLYDDGGDPHAAFADPTYTRTNWKGAVCVGKTTVATLARKYEKWDMVLLAITAHEIAHLAQHNTPMNGSSSVYQELIRAAGNRSILSELHADFMAGYYLGWLKAEFPRLSSIGVDIFMCEIGQHDAGRSDYHGSPTLRRNAYLAGHKLGLQRAVKFPGAVDQAIEYVATIDISQEALDADALNQCT